MLVRHALWDIRGRSVALHRPLRRIGSGRRFQSLSEAPALALDALRLRREKVAVERARERLSFALASLQAVDAALQRTLSLLQRLREIVLKGGDGTLMDAERKGLAGEAEELLEEILGVANSRFGDRFLFGGTKPSTPPFIREESGVRYQGGSESAFVSLGDGIFLPVTFVGSQIFQGEVDIFATVQEAIFALREGESDSLRQGILSRVDKGIEGLLTALAKIGAVMERGEAIREAIGWQDIAIQTTLSELQEPDLAEEVMRLRAEEVAYQATLLATRRLFQVSLVDFLA